MSSAPGHLPTKTISFFSKDQYQPGTSGGKQLLAHELTHTIQQGHAVQRMPSGKHSGGYSGNPAYSQMATQSRKWSRQWSPKSRAEGLLAGPAALSRGIVRAGSWIADKVGGGIGKILKWIADKAAKIPGFRMLTVILGVNPINMSKVDQSAANILRALIEFMPGGFTDHSGS